MRPRPVWISSRISVTLRSVHSSRTFVKYPGGGMMTPASPWMGSTRNADGILVDRRGERVEVAEGHDAEARRETDRSHRARPGRC